jgi:hypothetical protein
VPRVGAPARIGHFGGAWEPATVTAVDAEQRRVVVASASGETVEFTLNPATARWVAGGAHRGARLGLPRG